MEWLDKAAAGYCKFLELLLVLLMAVMVVMVFGNVVLRYAFNSGITVSEELSQPRPAPEGGFPQRHGITLPAPGSHRLVNSAAWRSRTKMSGQLLVSPGTRLGLSCCITTYLPFDETESGPPLPGTGTPAVVSVTRSISPVR